MKLRIGTFNAENLFARYKFPDPKDPKNLEKVKVYLKDGWAINDVLFEVPNPEQRRFTANVIRDLNADVLALQEIESLDILKRFNSRYLKRRFKKKDEYKYYALVAGNDPRFIDVAVLSRYPIIHIRSHQHYRRPDNRWWIFSRDCLEVDVLLPNDKRFTLYVNHLKSMIGGREKTMEKRRLQSEKVVEIVKERFGDDPSNSAFAILGDLNDYRDETGPSEGLAPLLNQPWLVDPLYRLPDEEQWTHYYKGQNQHTQLDYILLPKDMAEGDANRTTTPTVIRKGQPLRAGNFGQYPGVGANKPKASDHCPIGFDIDMDSIPSDNS